MTFSPGSCPQSRSTISRPVMPPGITTVSYTHLFDPELKTLGLIPPGRENTAILNLKLLDPEAELRPGDTPGKPRSQLSLTRMAASATMGRCV